MTKPLQAAMQQPTTTSAAQRSNGRMLILKYDESLSITTHFRASQTHLFNLHPFENNIKLQVCVRARVRACLRVTRAPAFVSFRFVDSAPV